MTTSPAPLDVYVAAGSNVDASKNLQRAAAGLQRDFGAVRFSPVYRNAAVGFEGEDFLNFAAAFRTDLPVEAVIERLQTIEGECGRTRDAPKWAPRSMDLDILLYGDLVCERPGLILPRPDLIKRPYMLGPMVDLAPELRHPTLGRTLAELWADFDRAAHPMHREPLTLEPLPLESSPLEPLPRTVVKD